MGKPVDETEAESPSKVAQTLDETKKGTQTAETGVSVQPVVEQVEETKTAKL